MVTIPELSLASLEGLPDDVLAYVFELLDSSSLACLRGVSRRMEGRVLSLGIPLYLAHNRIPSISLVGGKGATISTRKGSEDLNVAALKTQFYHTTQVSQAITRHDVCAVQIGDAWPRVMPALCLGGCGDALLLGTGSVVRIHPLRDSGRGYAHRGVVDSPIEIDVAAGDTAKQQHLHAQTRRGHIGRGRGGSAPTATQRTRTTEGDVVGVHALPTMPEGSDFVVAQFDGTVQRFTRGRCSAHYPHPRGTGIHSLVGRGSMVLTVSGGGGSAVIGARAAQRSAQHPTANGSGGTASAVHARLWNATSPWVPASILTLPSRAWSTLLAERGAFFGLRGGIYWHEAHPASGLASEPKVFTPAAADGETHACLDLDMVAAPSSGSRSAAYGLVAFPSTDAPASPLAHTLLSAWHDGTARLHDLRAGAQVLALADPWADSGLFSAAFAGVHGVVAGGAQHGVVNVWDVRFVRAPHWNGGASGTGGGCAWSIFSPHGRDSPVYALAGDGARVWGVTQRRAFVLAFDHAPIFHHGTRPGRADVGGEYWGRRGSLNGDSPYGHPEPQTFDQRGQERVMGYLHKQGMDIFDSRPF